MAHGERSAPLREEVLAQLESIAKSGVFRMKQDQDSQQLRILRHVVCEQLEGRGPTQRTILRWLGLEVSGVDKDESSVRVQMGLIRKKLARYYQLQKGAVVIRIPVGQYAPLFEYSSTSGSWTVADTIDLSTAQSACDRQTLRSCGEALRCVNGVLSRHPDCAAALALKADIHVIRAIQGMPTQPELDDALRAANLALEISPDLWQGHNAFGFVQSSLRNWQDAQRAFARARACTPPDVPTHFAFIAFLVARGRLDEAMRLMERDTVIAKGYYGHPTHANPVIRCDYGFLHLLAGALGTAKAMLESTIRDSPVGFVAPYLYLALAFEAEDDPERALAVIDAMPSPDPPGVELGVSGMLHGLAGGRATAQSILGQLLAASTAGHYVPPFQLGLVYLGLGDHQEALRRFRRAAADRDPLFHWMPYFPQLRHMAHLPELHALLGDLGFKWRWRRAESTLTPKLRSKLRGKSAAVRLSG